jgi:hypothetical protein
MPAQWNQTRSLEAGVELMRIPNGGLLGQGVEIAEVRRFRNVEEAVCFVMEQFDPAERELSWIRTADETLTYTQIATIYRSLARTDPECGAHVMRAR